MIDPLSGVREHTAFLRQSGFVATADAIEKAVVETNTAMIRAYYSHAYIVRRQGDMFAPEDVDVFHDYDLAKNWADAVGSVVDEEPVIDRETMNAMMAHLAEEAEEARRLETEE